MNAISWSLEYCFAVNFIRAGGSLSFSSIHPECLVHDRSSVSTYFSIKRLSTAYSLPDIVLNALHVLFLTITLSTLDVLTHLILPTTTWGRSYNWPLTDEAAETQWWTGHRLCIHTQVRVYISVCIHVFITLRPRILCFPCMCSLKPQITYKDLWFCFPDEETMVQRCVMMCPPRRSSALSIIMLWAGTISSSLSSPSCSMSLHLLTTWTVLGHWA